MNTGMADHRAFFDHLVDSNLATGFQVAVSRGGILLFHHHGGRSAPPDQQGIATSPETRFDVGSVTKPVLAFLLLRLVTKGLMSHQDPVRKFLPDFPFDDVTVAHILTHTSGIPATSNQPWPEDEAGMAEYRRRVCLPHERMATPGEVSEYWSSGYLLLLLIAEQVAKTTIESLARSELFDPLGMEGTTFEKSTVQDEEFFMPWNHHAKEPLRSVRHTPPIGETGLLSTAGDLLRFMHLFLAEGPSRLREEERDLALREATPSGISHDRTLVFWLRGDTNRHGCFGSGQSPSTVGHPAYSGCMVSYDPATEIAAAFVSNGMALASDFGNYARIQDRVALIGRHD